MSQHVPASDQLCRLPHAAYYVQGVKMSLGTLTENYYLKDDLSFDPPGVRLLITDLQKPCQSDTYRCA